MSLIKGNVEIIFMFEIIAVYFSVTFIRWVENVFGRFIQYI